MSEVEASTDTVTEATERVVKDDLLDTIFPPEQNDSWVLSDKIPFIVNEIEKLKMELKNFVSQHPEIEDLAGESETLCDEGVELSNHLKACRHEIENETMAEILRSIKDHDAIAHDLEKVNFSLNIVYDVVHCGKYFKDFDEYRRGDNFTAAAERLIDINEFLTTPAEGFSDLTMYEALKTSVELHFDEIIQEMTDRWSRMIRWDRQDKADNYSVIVINMNVANSQNNVDILLALNLCKKLTQMVSELAKVLLNEVLIPIVMYDCELTEERADKIVLTIPRTKYRAKDDTVQYDKVILMLRKVLTTLNNQLNVEVQAANTVMSLIGKGIGKDFGDILVKDCLVHTIPSSANELKSYSHVMADVEEFQKYCIEIGIFPKNYSIMYFAADLESAFAKKLCDNFLNKARLIMLKDLSESMAIGVESVPSTEEIAGNLPPNPIQHISILDDLIPKSLFYFPRCMISCTIQELIDCLLSMIDQAYDCSDMVIRRLYYTARLIVEMYEAVVPYHHEKYLLTIPQYVALFHNNCMYLAHCLLTLGEKWTVQLQDKMLSFPVSLVDLVPKVRALGYKHLTIHLQQQRKQILDNIRSSDLNCLMVKDVLGDNAEQAIRQCLRQLQVVKNVWIGIFPYNVYERLMSCLANMFVEEIVHRVCSVEDISAETATQLTEMYGVVVDKMPKLFLERTNLSSSVKSWVKLQQLIMILGGSLKDIERWWQDGRGALAAEFTIEELRSLIKALFQNTEFRANLLAKIK